MVKFANVKHFLMQQLAEQQEERQLSSVVDNVMRSGGNSATVVTKLSLCGSKNTMIVKILRCLLKFVVLRLVLWVNFDTGHVPT